jgi:hypothetical protein
MREVGPQRGEPVRHVTEVRQRTRPVLAALVYYETGFKTRMLEWTWPAPPPKSMTTCQ